MKRTLIFDHQMDGHHLEYIHHLYIAAGERSDEQFIFAVPTTFDLVSDAFEWLDYPNVQIYRFDLSDNCGTSVSLFKRSFYLSKLLKATADKFSVTHIFLIFLISYLPFLPFILSKKYKISGIIYQIYLYRWKESSIVLKIQDIFKYILMSKFRNIESVFILNDRIVPFYLNKKYNTEKFSYLPDPIVPIDIKNIHDLRDELMIKKGNVIFLHLGSMTDNKGTLEILESIRLLTSEECSLFTFIFAGKVQEDIRILFYEYYSELKNKVQIIVFDQFCSFQLIGSLCYTSNVILCPYKRIYQSSGIIGYAAQFNKAVIVPQSGLLGKIVRRNKLGLFFENTTPKGIYDSVRKLYKLESVLAPNNYLETNSPLKFVRTIFV